MSIQVWLYNKCHKIYLSSPLDDFLHVLRHPNHLRYLRARTIENVVITHQFLAAPVECKSRFFLTYWLYISAVSTFLNIRTSYLSASSGFRLLVEISVGEGMGPKTRDFKKLLG